MSNINNFIELISNHQISIDAWEDLFINDAINLVEKIIDEGKTEECLSYSNKLKSESLMRFYQSFLSIPHLDLFSYFINIINTSDDLYIAEIVIDNLRDWSLNDFEKNILVESSKRWIGKSVMLDKIINNLS